MKTSLNFALALNGLCTYSINPIFLAKPDGFMSCVRFFTILIEHCSMHDYQSIALKSIWDKYIPLQMDFILHSFSPNSLQSSPYLPKFLLP